VVAWEEALPEGVATVFDDGQKRKTSDDVLMA